MSTYSTPAEDNTIAAARSAPTFDALIDIIERLDDLLARKDDLIGGLEGDVAEMKAEIEELRAVANDHD